MLDTSIEETGLCPLFSTPNSDSSSNLSESFEIIELSISIPSQQYSQAKLAGDNIGNSNSLFKRLRNLFPRWRIKANMPNVTETNEASIDYSCRSSMSDNLSIISGVSKNLIYDMDFITHGLDLTQFGGIPGLFGEDHEWMCSNSIPRDAFKVIP